MVQEAMAAIPATSYVKSDDVHVAYQVFGEGSLDLLFVPGFVSNIEAMWESPAHRTFFTRLASFCRVILFDKRGSRACPTRGIYSAQFRAESSRGYSRPW
jgi:hypothetical protein